MPKTPRITAKKLVGVLLKNGFVFDRQRGSHILLRSSDGKMTVIPMHAGIIPIGTLKAILHDIDWTDDDLRSSV